MIDLLKKEGCTQVSKIYEEGREKGEVEEVRVDLIKAKLETNEFEIELFNQMLKSNCRYFVRSVNNN
eukprot:CAMPEP_0116875320 /NCGR_PEP_ID=MMETSP0463-20121206/7222_1 /TAXON_ID=181622 /ORGANISM="Strombidinopsis sp, Strain SopsisLIS2011" /LENGTH=66 /DNA_ID=CAMNT_0004520727 /DNA_START=545 /DNA_END=745 /DNA_ORIENTATION=-